MAKIAAIFQLLDKKVTVSSHRLELLSPARDAAIAREAILHGADAVYIGGPGFGARHNASNSLKDIAELVPFAHRYGAKIFVTLNTILHDDELEPAQRLITDLYQTGVDALIVQDMGIRFLSTTLKQLRQQRGWSLSRLAEATGVSKAMLGQIERNESSPTVATLWKIATGLNVPFSTFISPPQSATPSVYDPQRQAMVITSLFPYDPQLCFEHFSIQMAPGAISESMPHEKGVIEHVVVIDGQLDLCVDGEWQSLNCGEGVRFAADVTHVYRNGGEQTVHFHSLIHYPRS